MTRARETALVGLGLALVVLAVLAVRVIGASRAELAEGRAAEARDETALAIGHYRRAARMDAPFSPYSAEALERLADLGRGAEDAGDVELALSAWRSIRAAALGSRSFYVPHAESLREADEHIARLMASQPPPAMDARLSIEEREAAHLALLEAEVGPSPLASLLAILGLVIWVAAALLFATRALGEGDELVPREARRWAGVFALGLGMFVVGLYWA